MEGVPRMPMLDIELKHNSLDYSSLDWAGMPSEDVHEVVQRQITDALKKHIKEEYGDDPEKFNGAIEKFIEVQTAAYKAILSPDFEGCNSLKKYYGQLHYMQTRFPFVGDEGLKVTFTWQDAFTGLLTVQETFAFEQTAILFNIGAIHSILGAADNRTTEEGIRISCVHFQCAAGLFKYIADNFDTTLSADIAQWILKLFINTMLAQGQECLLEKSMQDNRKHSIVSKISQQVVDYYKQCLQSLENRETENVLGSSAYKSWRKMVNFKIAYYSAITKYFMGNNVLEQDKYGQAVTFFGAAVGNLNESAKLAKNFQKETRLKVEEAIKFTSDVLNGKYNSSVKDNNFVYHDKVPDASTLPEVKGASLVKALPFEPANESLTGPDIFAKLVPMEAHLAASTYSEEKAKLLRTVMEKVEEQDEVLDQYKQSIELDPKKLINPDEPAKLDQALIEKCALFSVDQSPINELKQALDELQEVYNDLDSVLNEILTIVETEELDDQKLQEAAGKDAFSIKEDIEGLKKDLASYKEIHHKALRLNEDLHTACRIHVQNMKLVAGGIDTVREELSIVNTSDLITEEDRSVIDLIRKLCEKVIEMEEQRKNLLQQLRQQMESDDVTSSLVTKHGVDQEDLFKEELKKYDSLIDTINKNLAAQDNILAAVTEANARYTKIRKTVEAERERVNERVTNIVLSCDVFDDVFRKCKEGHAFFGGVSNKAKDLYERAKEFHDENEAERKKIYKKIEEKKKPPPRPSAPKPKVKAAKKAPPTAPSPGMTLSPDVLAKMMAEDEDELLNDPEFLQFLQNQGDFRSMEIASSMPGSVPPNFPPMPGPATSHRQVPPQIHSISPSFHRPSVQSPTYPPVSSPLITPAQRRYQHPNVPRPSPQPTPPQVMSPQPQNISRQAFVPPELTRQYSGGSVVSDPGQSTGQATQPASLVYQAQPGQFPHSAIPAQGARPGPASHTVRVGPTPVSQHIASPQSMTPTPQTMSPVPQNLALPEMTHSPSTMAQVNAGALQMQHGHIVPSMPPTMDLAPHVPSLPQSMTSNKPQQIVHHNYYMQENQSQQPQRPIQVSQVAIVYSAPPPCQQSVASTYSQPLTTGSEYITLPSNEAQYSRSDSALQLSHRSQRPDYGPSPVPLQQYPTGPVPQMIQQGYPQTYHPAPTPPSSTPHLPQQHYGPLSNSTQQTLTQNQYPQTPPNNFYTPNQYSVGGPANPQPNIGSQVIGPYTRSSQQSGSPGFSSAPPLTQQPAMVSQHTIIRPEMPRQQGPGINQQPYMQPFQQQGTRMPHPQNQVASLESGQGFQIKPGQQIYQAHQQQQHHGGVPQTSGPQTPRMPNPTNQQVATSLAPVQSDQGFQFMPGQQNYQSLQPHHAVGPQPSGPQGSRMPHLPNQQFSTNLTPAQNIQGIQMAGQQSQQPPTWQGSVPQTSGPQQWNPASVSQPQYMGPQGGGNVPPSSYPGPAQQQQAALPPTQGAGPHVPLQTHISQNQAGGPQDQSHLTPISTHGPMPQNQAGGQPKQSHLAPVSMQRPMLQNQVGGQQNQGHLAPMSMQGAMPQNQAGGPQNQGQLAPTLMQGPMQPTSKQGAPQAQIHGVPHPMSTQGQIPQSSNSMPQLPVTPQPQISGTQQLRNLPQQAPTPPVHKRPLQGHHHPGQNTTANPPESYTFKSHPHAGQYLSTPSNESSPKHAPAQHSRQGSMQTPIQPAAILTPTPANEPLLPEPLPKQPSSDLAGLILTPSRSMSSSADELLFTSPDQGSNPTKNASQVVLVPTKVDEESDKMVVRPVEGLPYMDEADLMKFKGQVTQLRTKVSSLLRKPEGHGLCELDREWKVLSEAQEKHSRQLSTAIARCSSYKNRYQDIVPFDQSRVVLKQAKDDYINASVIDGVSPYCPRFIATQSPLPNTSSDFWLMVYEQQVNLIVMLVNSKDVPRKCPMYWPADRALPQQHGPLTVSFTTSKTHGDLYIERTFTIKHKNQSLAMSVTQLQYIAWPEHRFPSSASDLLTFVRVVQSYHGSQRNLQWPVLVHCESGVGRTGVFCGFVAAIKEINAGMGIMDVVEIVTKMRQKRKYMVQEKAQLKFVYDVVLYHAVDILKQRNVVLEDETKQPNMPQQTHQNPINPVQASKEFDIFSDCSALSSIQATVEKMTIKPGVEDMVQKNTLTKLESKSCCEIPTYKLNSVPNDAALRPSASEVYSSLPAALEFTPIEKPPISSPNIQDMSDLVQGTMNAPTQPPVLHQTPPQNAPKPDVVESCNGQMDIGDPEPQPAPNDYPQPRQMSSSPAALIESLTPESFTLNTDEVDSKKKQRITKEDFYKQRPGLSSDKDPSDPFSGLDPLWGLKK